jgi:hypothetical protein
MPWKSISTSSERSSNNFTWHVTRGLEWVKGIIETDPANMMVALYTVATGER